MSSREPIKWNADWKHKLIKNVNEFSFRQVHQWSQYKSIPTHWGIPSFLSPSDKFSNVFKVRKRLLPKMGHKCHYLQGPADYLTECAWLDVRSPWRSVSPWSKRVGKRPVHTPSDGTLCHTTDQVLSNYNVTYCDFRKWDHVARLSPDSVSPKPFYMTFKF